jgi:photosystem II stability/assembly factor-like uncharacterized protein
MSSAIRFAPVGAATGLALLVVLVHAAYTQSGSEATAADDPSAQVAEMMPRATRALTLDLVNAPERAIAVGERGHVLVSEDRQNWRQVENVPTRSTLTGVAAAGTKAWAVGHDGVILGSADGGLSWTRQRAAPLDPNSDDLHNGVPLLDVIALDEANVIAIGAYALMLRSSDGGNTWTQVELAATPAEAPAADEPAAADGEEGAWTFDQSELELDEETDPHLNAIVRTGDGSLFIVAERGSAFRSVDGGQSWQRLQLPYDGSMFGAIGYDGRHLLAFGLRGNVFETFDLGATWTKIDTGVDLSIMGGTGWNNGGAALVGANGVVLTRTQSGNNLLAHSHPDGTVLSSVFALVPNGELVVAGESGVGTFAPN